MRCNLCFSDSTISKPKNGVILTFFLKWTWVVLNSKSISLSACALSKTKLENRLDIINLGSPEERSEPTPQNSEYTFNRLQPFTSILKDLKLFLTLWNLGCRLGHDRINLILWADYTSVITWSIDLIYCGYHIQSRYIGSIRYISGMTSTVRKSYFS